MGASDKAAAAHHPRPTPPWICCWGCGHHSATDQLGAEHEARCAMRPAQEGK